MSYKFLVADKTVLVETPEDLCKVFRIIVDHAVERITARSPPEWSWPIFNRSCNKDLEMVLAQLQRQGMRVTARQLIEEFEEWHSMVLAHMTPEARDVMGLQPLTRYNHRLFVVKKHE